MANNNADIELLAGLSIDSSEAEILKAIKIIEKRLKANHDARFKLNVDIDETVIKNTVAKLQNILKGKELNIETKSSIVAITKEVDAMADVVTVARKAAKEKIDFAKANERVRNSADNTADAVNRERNAMESLDDVEMILNGINNCGQNGNSVFQRFGNTLRDAFSTYTTVSLLEQGLNKVVDAGKEALEIVKEFDDINVDLQLASGEDKGYVKQLLNDYSELGSELGALTQTVAESSDTFLRQGRSIADTNKLIEDSIVLSKIAKTDGENASEILTATINGFKLAANEGSRVNDVLSSIDLNSASDASGIGSALTKVASMANNAGVSLEKTAAMIATVKDVTQDADTTIGTSLKTVLSRMNSIRAGKFIDEETGEALNDVEKVLSGINVSMRDANGQFKEAEIVIDEVGAKWKTLDGNTQKAVTTAMGGVYQANKLVALFDNYEKVIELTNIASNSAGQALEKFNESYLPSLEAKTQALQNSFQQLATTTISDDFYASVLDVSKEVVDLTTETGILKSALVGIGVAGSLYAFSQLATYMREATQGFSNFSNALNMVNSGAITTANDMQTLVDLSHGLSNSQMRLLLSTNNLTDAQKIALMVANGVEQELAEQQLQTWGLINAQNTATSTIVTLTSSVRGFMATLAANPIALVTMAVTAGVTAFNKYKQAQEEVIQTAREASAVYKDTANSVDDYVAKYEELHKALLEAKGNEEETYNVKQQLLTLQTELNEKFANEADKLNLVTDAYKNQTEAVKELSKASANEFLNKNREGIEKANKEMNREKTYQLGSTNGLVNADELGILEEIKAIAESHGLDITNTGFEFVGNANEATDVINNFMNDIKELQTESGKTSDVMSSIFDGILDSSSDALGKADTIIDKYGDIFEQAQMATIATDANLSNGYNSAISAVEAYNEAVLKSENPYNDENVKEAWSNLQTVKKGIQENEEEWGQYSNIMDNVFDSANDKVYSFYDALTNDTAMSGFMEELRGLTDVEVQSMVNDGNEDAFDKLMEKAKSYGLEVQDVIDLLIELGVVQGKIREEAESVEESVVPSFDYKHLEDLESSISSIQSAYDTVISAMQQYNKQGYLDMDMVDSLIALDDVYINTLIDENGQLQYNSETFKQLAEIKLEEAKASLYQELCTELVRIKELDTALAAQELALANGTLTESAYETAKALYEEILAMGNANSELAKGKWEATQKKVALLDNQIKDVTTSTYDFTKSSGSASKEFSETIDFFEERVENLNDAISLLDKNLENVSGSFAKNKLISAEIDLNAEKMNNYSDALAMYSQKASEALSSIPSDLRDKVVNGAVDLTTFIGDGNEAVVESIKEYQKWSDKISDCQSALAELAETIRDLELEKFNSIMDDFQSQFDIRENSKSLIDKQIALFEEAGELIGESFYQESIEQSQKQLQILEQEKVALTEQLTSALASGNIQRGTDEWIEMVSALSDLDGQILDCKTSIEEFDNAILDLHTEIFERIQNEFSNLNSELENLGGLFEDFDVADSNGAWSKEGLSRLGLLSQQYELARYQVEQYNIEIAKLNEDYSNGKYSAIEYSDRLADLSEKQWDAVNSAESMKDAIVDLNKQRVEIQIEGIEEEISAYEELIQSKLDALDAEKSLADYRASISDKNKSITDIERQLAAMEGDNTASTIAKRKQLEQQLADARKDLEETQYDHSIEQQKDALNKELDRFTEEKDAEIKKLEESLEDRETLIYNSMQSVKENSAIIGQEITDMATQHGITISDAIIDSWASGEDAIASYGSTLSAQSSKFIRNIMNVENEVYALQAKANNTATSLSMMFGTRADNLIVQLTNSYNSAYNLNIMTNALQSSLRSTLEGGYNVSSITSALNSITDAANRAKNALDNLNTDTTVTVKSTGNGVGGGAKDVSVHKYASGTRSTKGNLFVKNEEGYELTLPKLSSGNYSISPEGSQILTKAQTDNIFDWSKIKPVDLVPQGVTNSISGLHDIPQVVQRNPSVNVHYDSLLTINGDVNDTKHFLKDMVQVARNEIVDFQDNYSGALLGKNSLAHKWKTKKDIGGISYGKYHTELG